jgi:hypothetical protein
MHSSGCPPGSWRGPARRRRRARGGLRALIDRAGAARGRSRRPLPLGATRARVTGPRDTRRCRFTHQGDQAARTPAPSIASRPAAWSVSPSSEDQRPETLGALETVGA